MDATNKNNEDQSNEKEISEKDYISEIQELRLEIAELKGEIIAVKDFSDDLVTASGNVLNMAEAIIPIALFALTTVIAVASLWLQHKFNKTKEAHLSEATNSFIKAILKNDSVRDEFVNEMVEHDDLRKNINQAIDRIAKERQETPDLGDLFHQLGEKIKKGSGNGNEPTS